MKAPTLLKLLLLGVIALAITIPATIQAEEQTRLSSTVSGDARALLLKLEEFEDAERKQVEERIGKMRQQVIGMLKSYQGIELQKDNVEGATAIRDAILQLEEQPQPSPAMETPEIPARARRFSGSHYLLVEELISWDEAQQKARAVSGELVVIESENENEFVADFLKGTNQAWIGKPDMTSYENWHPNAQPRPDSTAFKMVRTGQWDDVPPDAHTALENFVGYLVEWKDQN